MDDLKLKKYPVVYAAEEFEVKIRSQWAELVNVKVYIVNKIDLFGSYKLNKKVCIYDNIFIDPIEYFDIIKDKDRYIKLAKKVVPIAYSEYKKRMNEENAESLSRETFKNWDGVIE